jgi:hypothetical protein
VKVIKLDIWHESGAGRDKTELGQCLDPARCITSNSECFIVSGRVPVMFAPFEHEEDRAQDLVAQGHDGAFVSAAHEERLELRLEHRLGAAGGSSELAEQAPDIEIAFAYPTTRRFSMRVSASQAVRRCGTHFTVTSSPHHPTTPISAVQFGSVGSDPQLDDADRLFREPDPGISANRSG